MAAVARDAAGDLWPAYAAPVNADTIYFWRLDPANVELVVKIYDNRQRNGHFWIFAGALSNVDYDLTVTDTLTGERRSYLNPSGQAASVADTRAFPSLADRGFETLAKELAQQVLQARSDAERRRALLAVMDALNVGVYDTAGRAIRPGAERAPGDFYLYDLEIEMMGRSLARGDSWSVADVAEFFNRLGILRKKKRLQPEKVRKILLEGMRQAAASPEDKASLVPLLARELRLHGKNPYDLLANPALESLRFDGLPLYDTESRLHEGRARIDRTERDSRAPPQKVRMNSTNARLSPSASPPLAASSSATIAS